MDSDKLPIGSQKFKGYTIDEIKYLRTVTLLRREFCKEHLINKCHGLASNNPFTCKKKSGIAGSSFLGNVLKGFSYFDYAVVGYNTFKSVMNFVSLFRKKH